MKKILKTYRTFCPDLLTLATLLVCPVVIFLMNMALVSEIGYLSLIFASVWMLYIDYFGDYFAYNGVLAKDYEYGMLRCSLQAKDLLKIGAVTDQIRRLIQFTLSIVPTMLLVMSTGKVDNLRIIFMSLSLIFGMYAANTASLLVLRKVITYNIYFSLGCFMVTVLGCAVAFLVGFLSYYLRIINPAVPLFVSLFISLHITRFMVKAMQNNYYRSFKEAA